MEVKLSKVNDKSKEMRMRGEWVKSAAIKLIKILSFFPSLLLSFSLQSVSLKPIRMCSCVCVSAYHVGKRKSSKVWFGKNIQEKFNWFVVGWKRQTIDVELADGWNVVCTFVILCVCRCLLWDLFFCCRHFWFELWRKCWFLTLNIELEKLFSSVFKSIYKYFKSLSQLAIYFSPW